MKPISRKIIRWLINFRFIREPLRFVSRRGFLHPKIMIRLPIEGEFQVLVNKSENFTYNARYGDGVGRMLYWNGAAGFEPETIDVFDKLARKAQIFADIGANTGHFTLYALAVNPEIKTYGFEPVQRTFDVLSRNIEINNWQQRCELHNLALGTEDGEVRFHVPFDETPTSASLNPDGFNNIEGEIMTVQARRFDTIFDTQIAPDLIKIDVEGFEEQVLKGISGLFEKDYRPLIIFENNPEISDMRIAQVLKPLDYTLSQICQRNWLAEPQSKS